MSTIISWTNETWNPVTGCVRVSEGCRNCYAERISMRYGWSKLPWTKQNEVQNIILHPDRLSKPYRIKKPSMIFVNSMSDLFQPAVPDEFITEVFKVMNTCPAHTFQILTKRPERAAVWPGPWAENIWMGTSIEDETALHRLDAIRKCGAEIRFVSFEPLIGRIGKVDLSSIHWVIVGGESGPNYRPMNHQWAREIRDQCVKEGVAFFFKQDAAKITETRPWLDGMKWQQYPGTLSPPVRIERNEDRLAETHGHR
jgi:protein gp37